MPKGFTTFSERILFNIIKTLYFYDRGRIDIKKACQRGRFAGIMGMGRQG
jgi:hypothetical protein